MLGKIVLVIYVLIQIFISLLTEFTVKNHRYVNKIGKKSRKIRTLIYGFLAVIPVLGAFLPKSKFKFFCMEYGNIWLGFFMFYSACVIFLIIILRIAAKITKRTNLMLIGHALHFSFVIGLILTIYGLVHAQNPKLVSYDIELSSEAPEDASEVAEAEPVKQKDIKIVLLADLHLSVNSDIKATKKMVELVNECNPDLIVIAGDIFTSNYEGLKNPEKYAAELSKMHAKYGVYAVCGNHDVDENLFSGFPISPISEAFRTSDMDKFFKDAGFNVLYDEEVEIGDGLFTLVGRVDGEKAGDGTAKRLNAEELLKNIDKSKPIVVLQHEPIEFKSLAENGADLVLCGHTHDGQIFPGNLIVPFFNENGYGVKELYGATTVVTAGVGYYGPPIRLGTDSEVTLLNIKLD